ncbi:MAG: tetratricopeptide repeat protein [Nannocystis sp.]|nr:tetratricopeptide repeat protein [Nannocystis sp.]
MSRPDRDDPLESPELRRLIQGMRARQPLPVVKVTADQIYARWSDRREQRRRRVRRALAGVAAAAVIILGVARAERSVFSDSTIAPSAPARQLVAGADAPGLDAHAAPLEITPQQDPTPPAPPLDRDIHLSPRGPGVPAPEVLAARVLRLGVGAYLIDHDGAPLRVHTVDGELELHAGVYVVAVAADRTEIQIERGAATWIAGGPASASAAARPLKPAASPAELARIAEAHLTAGRREQAARALRRLLLTYPDAEESQRGLLDLARLHRTLGEPDEARCAYQLYLDRHPKAPLRGEVTAALDRLGPGPTCRGLRPR